MEVPLTYDLMIPSSVNIENEALQPDIILGYKKREECIADTSDFGLNDAEIKKMTKHQDLKNELRRSWKLKNVKVVSVIAGAKGMIKNHTDINHHHLIERTWVFCLSMAEIIYSGCQSYCRSRCSLEPVSPLRRSARHTVLQVY